VLRALESRHGDLVCWTRSGQCGASHVRLRDGWKKHQQTFWEEQADRNRPIKVLQTLPYHLATALGERSRAYVNPDRETFRRYYLICADGLGIQRLLR